MIIKGAFERRRDIEAIKHIVFLYLFLKNRFESEIVRNNLLNEGIHIENIDNPSDYNEFINKTMWIRSNLNINLTCLYKIKNIDSYSEYENISNINII